jgi:toxin ParE1/3/4
MQEFRIKILPKVLKDLKEAKQWYNEQKEFLGDEFKFEVNKESDYIEKNPFGYQIRFKEFRKFLLNRFPYCIYYVVEESIQKIIVFGVLHNKSGDEKIMKRLK